MRALAKTLLILLVLVVQAVAYLLLWDGDGERAVAAWEAVRGRGPWTPVTRLTTPDVSPGTPVRAPMEFFDLVERNFPDAWARHFDAASTGGLGANFAEARDLGRKVYIREGCIHCHTQFVRAEGREMERWGAPTRLGDADIRRAGLPLTGLRRVGPDLANEGGLRSNDWHAAHLFRPQSIARGSIMPAYPWLFEDVEGRVQPTREGLALIVYLQSLGG